MSSVFRSVEFKIKFALSCFVLAFLTLVALLTSAWGWSLLATVTALFVLSYPLCWLAWRVWQFWASSIMRLTTYTQGLAMGESSVSVARQGKSVLLDELHHEITQLYKNTTANKDANASLAMLFGQLFEDLPIAVVIFEQDYTLSYANRAAYDITEISLLQGVSAKALGFVEQNKQLNHSALASNWRCQSSLINFQQRPIYLFTAIDISSEIKQSEQAVQKNLVRVLSHELRNTLTPMSSMAETLLSMDTLDTTQTRKVLERVKTRSDDLLSFVERFAEVAKIPEPKKERFDLSALIEQTKVLLSAQDSLTFTGQHICYADAQLLAQVLMNLVKNAVESKDTQHHQYHDAQGVDAQVQANQGVAIEVNYYQQDNQQYLSVIDNGTGFSNIDNAITPLFTTKPKGAGIGLAFVEAVLNKHGGIVRLSNQVNSGAESDAANGVKISAQTGAKVELIWPLHH
ncbi:sensor histidine kinase [Thalassotalea euphylliae]|uniref:sensor histidine kinase n=1 Tax=Thalassotalea euphylliae TaxID=1655234 RepID=UPI0015F28DAC|nr:ATP-binding protein [Thalassotalea euphylliae]